MFSVEQRDRVRDGVLEIARADTRIVAGAMIGSLPPEAATAGWTSISGLVSQTASSRGNLQVDVSVTPASSGHRCPAARSR
jgi:hypothetical protein